MKKLTTPAGVFGPYAAIETLIDRYRCDGADLPFSVVGEGAISEWVGPMPQPEPDLDALRAAKNDEINAARLKATFETFEHQGKSVSCDELSRSDIDGINGYVALNGVFPDIWPGAWKCADNTYLPIASIDEWKAFYGAMVAAGSALYAHAQELKTELATAETAEEIAAIMW